MHSKKYLQINAKGNCDLSDKKMDELHNQEIRNILYYPNAISYLFSLLIIFFPHMRATAFNYILPAKNNQFMSLLKTTFNVISLRIARCPAIRARYQAAVHCVQPLLIAVLLPPFAFLPPTYYASSTACFLASFPYYLTSSACYLASPARFIASSACYASSTACFLASFPCSLPLLHIRLIYLVSCPLACPFCWL